MPTAPAKCRPRSAGRATLTVFVNQRERRAVTNYKVDRAVAAAVVTPHEGVALFSPLCIIDFSSVVSISGRRPTFSPNAHDTRCLPRRLSQAGASSSSVLSDAYKMSGRGALLSQKETDRESGIEDSSAIHCRLIPWRKRNET